MAKTEELKINITGDSSSYKKAMQEANDITAKVSGAVQSFIGNLAANAVANLVSNVQQFAVTSLAAYKETEMNQAKLNAVLASTQEAAGLTAKELNNMATALMNVTTFDDDAITGAQSLLLTFTKIGKDVFPDATKTVLNMSAALGQDLKSSSIQLGKALNDPIKGMTALTRVGVSFSESQRKQIEYLQQSGDLMGAQKIILRELATEFGGSAEAIANTTSGRIEQFKNKIGNIQEEVGKKLSEMLDFILKNQDAVITAITAGLGAIVIAWAAVNAGAIEAAIATTIATGGLNLLIPALVAAATALGYLFVSMRDDAENIADPKRMGIDKLIEESNRLDRVLLSLRKSLSKDPDSDALQQSIIRNIEQQDKLKKAIQELAPVWKADAAAGEDNADKVTQSIEEKKKAEEDYHKKMMSNSDERGRLFAENLKQEEQSRNEFWGRRDQKIKNDQEMEKSRQNAKDKQLELDETRDAKSLNDAIERSNKESEILHSGWARVHSDMWDTSRSFTEKVSDLIKDMVMNFTLEVGNMVIAHALGEESKTAATSTGVAARVGMALWESAKSIGSKIAEGVVWLVTEGYKTATVVAGAIARVATATWEFAMIAAKKIAEIGLTLWSGMLEFFSFLGPFAIPAAAAGVALGIAAVKESVSAIGFAKGGEFEQGQRGFIEGTVPGGEIIAPKKDFMQVITQLIPSITLANSGPQIDYNQLAMAISANPPNIYLNATKVNTELSRQTVINNRSSA